MNWTLLGLLVCSFLGGVVGHFLFGHTYWGVGVGFVIGVLLRAGLWEAAGELFCFFFSD